MSSQLPPLPCQSAAVSTISFVSRRQRALPRRADVTGQASQRLPDPQGFETVPPWRLARCLGTTPTIARVPRSCCGNRASAAATCRGSRPALAARDCSRARTETPRQSEGVTTAALRAPDRSEKGTDPVGRGGSLAHRGGGGEGAVLVTPSPPHGSPQRRRQLGPTPAPQTSPPSG